MTKDELLDKLEILSSHNKSGAMLTVIRSFFSQNVCIPKGANRHPYADVLHEWIEGRDIEGYAIDEWLALENVNTLHPDKYRIKPSKPVYEWKYAYEKYGEIAITDLWFTDEEYLNTKQDYPSTKLNWTKRERK